jgi:hypothetical protein
MIDLAEAKRQVTELLDMANGDAEVVFRSIIGAQNVGRQYAGYTEEHDANYGMLRLALADLTGIAAYRL